MTLDFGNVVNNRKPNAQQRWMHKKTSYHTASELAYDFRAHQAAQLIHLIGEALQCRNPELGVSLCIDAEECLAGLRKIIGDGHFS